MFTYAKVYQVGKPRIGEFVDIVYCSGMFQRLHISMLVGTALP